MTDKNRHTAHISELEKEQAARLLELAARFCDQAPIDAAFTIRYAMKILGMKENTDV